MKKRIVALLLCGMLCITSTAAVAASDFEPESDAAVTNLPEFLAEEETEELTETTADPAEDTLIQPEASETESVEAPTDALEEDGSVLGEKEIAAPGESEGNQESEETGESEEIEASELSGDFTTEAAVVESEAVSDNTEVTYVLGENEVFVSAWEYRTLENGLQFRLAEPAEVISWQAGDTNEEANEKAAEDEAIEADVLQEEMVSQEEDGFIPLAEDPSGKAGAAETGKEYFTGKDGIVHIITVDADGDVLADGYYLFDDHGIMLTGQQVMEAGTKGYTGESSGTVFFTDSETAVPRAGAEGESATPANSDLGQQKKDTWVWTGSVFQYYDTNGTFISVPDLKAAAQKNASTYTGYFEINGSRYVLKDDGTPYINDYTMKEGIRPGTYYLYPAKNPDDIPGKMAVSTWVYLKLSTGERWRYYDADGRTDVTNRKATVLDKTLNPAVGDKKYLLTAKGYIYTKAAMVKLPDGAYYGCNAKGVVYQNKLGTFNSIRYYFGEGGKRVTWSKGWHRCPGAGNRYYYFKNSNGRILEKTGWIKITESNGTYGWYYFPKSGNHYIKKWTKTRYFHPDGKLASGLTTVNGKGYFFTVSDANTHRGAIYKNKLLTYDQKKYYATADGSLAKSKWINISGSYYYFQANYTMMTNQFVTGPNGKTHGYVDSTGKFQTGWVIVSNANNQIKYLNPSGKGYLTNRAAMINGVRYYFDSDGYRVSDLTKFNLNGKKDSVLTALHAGKYTGKYILECDKSNGVITIYVNTKKYGKVPVRCMRTSVGYNINNTPNGTYTIHRYAVWTGLMGPSWGQYGSHVTGGIFMHSIACPQPNRYNLNTYAYDRLGSPASAGCMRLCVADAKWIYDNCNGCKVTIFTGTYKSDEVYKGPLGRKPLVPRFGAGNFDPTDPAIVGDKYY